MSESAGGVLPRELAPGVFWVGDCSTVPVGGTLTHSYSSVYVVSGEAGSMVVDTGMPKDWASVNRQLDELLADGRVAPIRFLTPTHPEAAHSGNLGRLLDKFPESMVYGEVRDYHLVFPGCDDRLCPLGDGDTLDLGGRTIRFLPAVFKDLIASIWMFDEQERILFPGDGFSYLHYHGVGDCGQTAEEVGANPITEMTSLFAEAAFYWTRFVDIEPVLAELTDLIERYQVQMIAQGHGSPVTDLPGTLPRILGGFRLRGEIDPNTIVERIASGPAASAPTSD